MWDQRYREPGFAYGTEPNDFLVASLPLFKPGSGVLCLAEGEGRNGVYLAQHGHQVTAVDSSAVGLEKAQQLCRSRGVSLKTVQADLASFMIPPDGYDAIVSIFCHLPGPLRKDLHRRVQDGLRPGGLFLLEGYAKGQLERGTGGPQNKELLLDLEDVKNELAGLHLARATELEREIHEGSYHNGIGAVIQIVGLKDSG
ncbi:MAG: class I SAM-dependent methyltransferase [Desulfocapsaceae bacterium]